MLEDFIKRAENEIEELKKAQMRAQIENEYRSKEIAKWEKLKYDLEFANEAAKELKSRQQ